MSGTQYTYVGKSKHKFELQLDNNSKRYDAEPKELESFGVAPDIRIHQSKSKVSMPLARAVWDPPSSPANLAINKGIDSTPLKPIRDDRTKVSGYARIKSIHLDNKKRGLGKARAKPRIFDPQFGKADIPVRVRTQLHALRTHREAIHPMLPPSLKKLAVNKAPQPSPKPMHDPFTSRTKVQSISNKNREIFQALLDGEWVYCDDIGFFPRRLREWLRHCRVRLLRWEGGVSAVTPTGTPLNAYVTEDGVTFYVTEDGATFYVQET